MRKKKSIRKGIPNHSSKLLVEEVIFGSGIEWGRSTIVLL